MTAQVKKADQRMYHVRRLSKLKIDNEILCLFYNSTVSSVLVYAVPCWFNQKCKSLISKIVKDETHPLYPYITTLPHRHLRVPWSRTERFRKSFLPYAIKPLNSD